MIFRTVLIVAWAFGAMLLQPVAPSASSTKSIATPTGADAATGTIPAPVPQPVTGSKVVVTYVAVTINAGNVTTVVDPIRLPHPLLLRSLGWFVGQDDTCVVISPTDGWVDGKSAWVNTISIPKADVRSVVLIQG